MKALLLLVISFTIYGQTIQSFQIAQKDNIQIFLYPGQEFKSSDEGQVTIIKCTQRCSQQQCQQQQQCGPYNRNQPTRVSLRV